MKRFVSSDGIEIAYQEWGRDRTGVPVVLHHGFAVNADVNWLQPGIVDGLLAAGRWVAAPDARGHGRSDHPHDPARYGESVMARDLRTLFDIIGTDRVDLVGYSMGAVISLIAATQEPRIRRLVVGGVGGAVVELGGVDTRLISQDALVGALEANDPSAITDPAAAAFRQLADAVGADRRALAAQVKSVNASPIALHRIAAPTLILAGDADPLAQRPEMLAAAIAGSQLKFVPGDHFTAVTSRAFRDAIVDFLGDLPR